MSNSVTAVGTLPDGTQVKVEKRKKEPLKVDDLVDKILSDRRVDIEQVAKCLEDEQAFRNGLSEQLRITGSQVFHTTPHGSRDEVIQTVNQAVTNMLNSTLNDFFCATRFQSMAYKRLSKHEIDEMEHHKRALDVSRFCQYMESLEKRLGKFAAIHREGSVCERFTKYLMGFSPVSWCYSPKVQTIVEEVITKLDHIRHLSRTSLGDTPREKYLRAQVPILMANLQTQLEAAKRLSEEEFCWRMTVLASSITYALDFFPIELVRTQFPDDSPEQLQLNRDLENAFFSPSLQEALVKMQAIQASLGQRMAKFRAKQQAMQKSRDP